MLDFFDANNGNRTCSRANLLPCLRQCIHSCVCGADCSDENNDLLTGVAAMGNAFISFHVDPPVKYLLVSMLLF